MSIGIDDLTFLVLSADHNRFLTTFHCKNPELKDFLVDDAYQSQSDRVSVTRIVFHNGRLIGYFTLVTDVIKKTELADGDGEPDFRYNTYPALKIARLATHQEFERQGVGRGMLMKIFAIWIRFSAYIGCRIITVDAKPDAVGFYKKFGFHEAVMDYKKLKDRDIVHLYIDIHKEIERIRSTPTLNEFNERM